MQDFLGQELKEGDIIFYHMTTGRGRKQACIGRVEKVREKTAAIKIIKHERQTRNGGGYFTPRRLQCNHSK